MGIQEAENCSPAAFNAGDGSTHTRRLFKAGDFEGPLDLLCMLIRDNKINIYDIPIVQITEEYLDYLDSIAETDLGDLSDFYRLASRLIYIKSQTLVPCDIVYDGDEDDVEDSRRELIDELIEYQRFKKLSALIEDRENVMEWSFDRKKIQRTIPFDNDESAWERVDTQSLLQQMQRVFRGMVSVYSDEKIINIYEEISVNEKMTLMCELLENKGECMFTDLIVHKGNELDVICAFMAVLEAVKFKIAVIFQNKLFGDIKIRRCDVD